MEQWLMTLQIQISIAVVAILILRQAMKKMPKVYSYLLWLLVFARLLVPVSIESRFSFMPSEQEREMFTEQVLESLGETGENRTEIFDGNQPAHDNAYGNGVVDGSAFADIEGVQEDAEIFVDSAMDEEVSWDNAEAGNEISGAIFLLVWAIGAAAVLGYNGLALVRVRKLLGSEKQLEHMVISQKVTAVNPITGREKIIPIHFCKNISTPFTLGLLKPAIFLPAGLTEEEQEYILCHEQVHINRKDNLVKHVAFLLTAIYWFNPFVWVAFFLMERDMEMSCDEKVIKLMGKDIKRNYSQSLLDFAARPKKMPATHLTFGENSVKQRVKNVLSYKNAKKWTVGIGAVVLIVVVVALFTTGRDESVPVDGQGNVAKGEDVQTGGQGSLAQGEDVQADDQADNSGDASGSDQTQNGSVGESVVELILTKESFDSRYGKTGNYDFSVTGYEDGFYRSIIQQLFYDTNAEGKKNCEKMTDPVTAAMELLNLGEGIGAVADTSSMLYRVAEGTEVTVVYIFAKDNSVVEIPMVLIEGSFGIWAPKGTPVRKVENSQQIWSNVSEDGTMGWESWIEITQYGIYRILNEQLICLYPGYVNPKNDFHVYDNILYFVVDSDYVEGAAEYQEDAIAMLDLNTLQVDKDAIPLNINRTTAPITRMHGGHGILEFMCNNQYYHVPMVNTGDVKFSIMNTFNGKMVMELTENEQNAYAVTVREQLLQNPGLVLELSNRTLEETFALIDMDGDGWAERIFLSPDPNATGYTYGSAFDNFQLKIGGSKVVGRTDNLYNQIFAFSMNGKEIVVALQEDGPSGDPQTHLFLYRNGEVKAAGSFANYITFANIVNGNIYTEERIDVIQTDGTHRQYTMNENGELVSVEQDTYDFTGLNDIKLLVELPLRDTPDGEIVVNMKPQTVHFLKTDKTFEWVYVEGEDGTGGWFHVENFSRITELNMNTMEVFEGLNMAG